MTDQDGVKAALEGAYEAIHSDPELMEMADRYSERHGIKSAAILTVTDDERAGLITGYLSERVQGRTVVEIGAGIGLLALHLAGVAKRVIAIEANPMWMSVFAGFLYANKPKNVTWIFGSAEEMVGMVQGEVALFCTHSDHEGMRSVAAQFAPEVIDVYREIVELSRRESTHRNGT